MTGYSPELNIMILYSNIESIQPASSLEFSTVVNLMLSILFIVLYMLWPQKMSFLKSLRLKYLCLSNLSLFLEALPGVGS